MRERRRKNFSKGYSGNFVIGKASIMLVAIGLVFALGLLYLSQSNSIAVKGATLTELEAQKAELVEERDRLQVEATRLQSLKEIEQELEGENDGEDEYVPVDKINYLPSSNVAVK